MARKPAKGKGRSATVAVPAEFLADLLQKGVLAHRAGKLGEAETLYRQVLDIQADHADANHLLGLIAHQVGRHGRAIQLIKKAIAANSGNPAFHANLGAALHKEGRLDDAQASCRKAIALDPDYPEGHANLADALHGQGKLDEAITAYRGAIAIDPEFSEAHNNLGNVLKENGQLDDALACYRQALSINPHDAEAHFNVGFALQELGRSEDAMASYGKALEINENFALAHFNLSNLYEKTFELEKADHHVRQALRIYPDHPGANVSLAVLMRRAGETGAAIELLEELVSKKLADGDACGVHFELGKLYDLEKQSERAFTHLTLANKAQARDVGHKAAIQAQDYRQWIENTAAVLDPEFMDTWISDDSPPQRDQPVFLVGFPRSGTTLLDQILDAHPQLQVMEENPAMDAARAHVETMKGGYPAALATLTGDDIEHLREIYWQNVDQFLKLRAGAILIDKLPLNITNIPLIVRLFPSARFILALRHPLDVILSNFMQFYQLNDATSNFMTLKGTATLYRLIMGFWLQCAKLLALNFHTTKYEDLVADLEAVSRGMLEFLGVDWDEGVLEYHSHARQRGVINTPSYAQVTEPIYKRAKYRWSRYDRQLSPIIDIIQPLAAAFDYACTSEERPDY